QSEISNPLVLIDVDGDRIPDYLDADTDGPGAGDSDEDGIPDDEECPQGYLCPDSEGDNMPDYMQPVGEVIRSPVYMVWNSFLKQANIVVIVNKSNEEADIVVRVLDIEGGLLGLQSYSLAPSEEFDLIVNELPGYSEDTYGTVRIDFTPPRSIEGHSAIYRFSDTASSLELQPQASGGNNLNTDFAILLPFASSVKGTTYAFFDTIQPSRSEIDENNGIPHWVQIGNAHESHIKGFTVNKYDRDGVLIESVRTLVPPQGRRDIEGGHAVPGPNQVGLLEIVPDDPESRYIAQVFHYGQNSPIGVMPTDFNFAMGESSRSGSALVQYAVVSTGAGSTNWIAIANTAAEPEAIQTKIIDNDGTVVFDQAIFLGPRAQTHLLANAVLPQGHSGVAIMTPLTGKGIIGNTRSYYFDE
ncbi:MAG TPA: hypothetical protein PLP17_15245, partial [Oligoflexia bacterium]|nr:hypothetical protein [Oligoflexia bacterium]